MEPCTPSGSGVVITDSDNTVVVEGNHYVPAESVRMEFLSPSRHHTVCPRKGTASYYDVVVDGAVEPQRRLVLPPAEPGGAPDRRTHGVTEMAHFVDTTDGSNFWGVYLTTTRTATPTSSAPTA